MKRRGLRAHALIRLAVRPEQFGDGDRNLILGGG
ncbi:hypothetical protein MSIMFB_00828 [Mycobacterium simulans]|uniref:Uncharacterized protein n=1 Tax=Mycobacterium simulans TaxID=627089 RepID=A0A7Z7IH30_9MYCO|nr:hypothetical protein MSIMFB_00828 [Mycobacterium simulans]